MAPNATLYHVEVELSDVDRSVYLPLDLRIARHPSEGERYLATRTLAYCLSYEEGIAWSRGGVSSADEPPVLVRNARGELSAWIDVGSPAAERIHRAAKAAERVAIFTHSELSELRREALLGRVHRAGEIEVVSMPLEFLNELGARFERSTKLGLLRNDGVLYATVGDRTFEAPLVESRLADQATAPAAT